MLKRNLIANYLGQGWVAVMGLAFVPMYIKYLGIEAYGLIGLFTVLTAWMTLLDMGMTPTLSREMARFTGGSHDATSIRDLLRSIEVVAIVVAIIIAVGIALASNWMASSWVKVESLPMPVVAQAFTIMGLVTAMRFIENIYRSCLIGLQQQVLFNAIKSSMATFSGLGAVCVLAWISPTIQVFFLWQGLVSLTTLMVLAIATYTTLPKSNRNTHFSFAALKGIWQFAGGMMSITLLVLLLTQVDKILLSKLLNLKEYGYYTLASVVAGSIYILISPITQAWYPIFNQLHAADDQQGLIRAYHKAAQLVTVIAGSAAIVLIVFSDTFLNLWTGNPVLVSKTAPLLSLLMFGNLLHGLMIVPYQVQLAYGWTSLSIYINIVAVLIIVPAILWIAPRYGAIGTAWIWVSLTTGYSLIGIQFMYQKILCSEKWQWYWYDVLVPLCVTAGVVLSLRKLLPESHGILGQFFTLAIVSLFAVIAASIAAQETRKLAQTLVLKFIVTRGFSHVH